jgi:hypothetical protein
MDITEFGKKGKFLISPAFLLQKFNEGFPPHPPLSHQGRGRRRRTHSLFSSTGLSVKIRRDPGYPRPFREGFRWGMVT